ncbi:GNAT family N-acetyltransferase [Streptomyces sp. YIM 130001]|uniref:GNAT family N-acetyltransferase n=1 Tax=Streptomyces sp. YIM 130001 TaxID=2259644 RepID=UPI000E64DA55|nr:GNAT family N-acetyltransferase [Streptomyces sp. YIM 130001]
MSIRVRAMTLADAEAVAAIRVRGWQSAYRGLVPDGHLDAMDVTENAARQRERLLHRDPLTTDLVAERDGVAIGWGCVGPYRPGGGSAPEPADRPDGELYALYVDPHAFGTGAGRALLTALLEMAAAAGHGRLLLWVLEGNVLARRFYERSGFTADGAHDPCEVDGVPAPEVRYCRPLPRT